MAVLLTLPWCRPSLARLTIKPSGGKFITARFTRTLGTLLQSGVPILQALSITKDVASNVVMERAIDAVIQRALPV